jgi:hypothetical protein
MIVLMTAHSVTGVRPPRCHSEGRTGGAFLASVFFFWSDSPHGALRSGDTSEPGVESHASAEKSGIVPTLVE